MDITHWDLDNEKTPSIPDISGDIELSMNKLFLSELEENDEAVKTEKIVVPPLNPKVLHAIALHKHTNHIIEMIKLKETNKNLEKIEFKLPIYEESSQRSANLQNLNLTKEDFHNFTLTLPDLNKTIVRQILIKSVVTLFAHLGYETGQQSALDVLTDVLEEFLRKISHQAKVALDDEENNQYSGFPHVIERVLTEMGIGGVKSLNDYYQSRVVKYLKVLENRWHNYHQDYQALSVPKQAPPVDKFSKIVRVKVEEEDVIEVENSEVHFSTIDGDVNLSILETGYQLLNSLEAETNFNSMTDEDITESPGIVSLSSDETSHLSPYNKKKRFK